VKERILNPPKVSVLIPSYNCARYLPEAIESVLGQDFRDFELLIIDDCSTDDSRSVIQHYATLDSRIMFQTNLVNLGAVQNWNRCLAQARGEYVKLLCCDDALVSAQALSKIVRLLEAHPAAVMAVSARNIIDEASRLIHVCDALHAPGWHEHHKVAALCLGKGSNLIGEPSAVLFRRRNADRGFDPRYRQIVDLEMWFHLLEQGGLVYTPEPLCAFRRHPLQLTQFNAKHRLGVNEMAMLVRDYYPKPWLTQHVSRKSLFLLLYYLRKRNHGQKEMCDIKRQMLETLGSWRYAAFWIQHKVLRPFSNLGRFLLKHVLHRPVG
jgi:glycosyltransferase involved in cell wall biosynthesis